MQVRGRAVPPSPPPSRLACIIVTVQEPAPNGLSRPSLPRSFYANAGLGLVKSRAGAKQHPGHDQAKDASRVALQPHPRWRRAMGTTAALLSAQHVRGNAAYSLLYPSLCSATPFDCQVPTLRRFTPGLSCLKTRSANGASFPRPWTCIAAARRPALQGYCLRPWSPSFASTFRCGLALREETRKTDCGREAPPISRCSFRSPHARPACLPPPTRTRIGRHSVSLQRGDIPRQQDHATHHSGGAASPRGNVLAVILSPGHRAGCGCCSRSRRL